MDTKFKAALRIALIGFSARDMAIAGSMLTIEPHRTNDGSDNEEDWCFKVRVFDRDGVQIDIELL